MATSCTRESRLTPRRRASSPPVMGAPCWRRNSIMRRRRVSAEARRGPPGDSFFGDFLSRVILRPVLPAVKSTVKSEHCTERFELGGVLNRKRFSVLDRPTRKCRLARGLGTITQEQHSFLRNDGTLTRENQGDGG